MVAKLAPDDTYFAAAWNDGATVDDVASRLGLSKRLAIQTACRLRKKGLRLKKFGQYNLTAVCDECGIEFKVFRCEVKAGKLWYCSRVCANKNVWRNSRTHGESGTRLHQIWCHMKTRCTCPTSRAYSYYGGRGISVCGEWMASYECFRDWAHANGYATDLELDRIDTNGNYEPGNCRWANRTQQMRNTRKRANAKTSRYKGVSLHRSNGKWKVQVCVPGKPIHRGLFMTEIEAAREYDRIVRIEFGEYAMTNFKEETSCCACPVK